MVVITLDKTLTFESSSVLKIVYRVEFIPGYKFGSTLRYFFIDSEKIHVHLKRS